MKRVLSTTVANDALTVVTDEHITELNRVGLRQALERLELAKRKTSLGAGTGLDVVRAQQDVENARATLVSGDENAREAREAFGLAIGVAEDVERRGRPELRGDHARRCSPVQGGAFDRRTRGRRRRARTRSLCARQHVGHQDAIFPNGRRFEHDLHDDTTLHARDDVELRRERSRGTSGMVACVTETARREPSSARSAGQARRRAANRGDSSRPVAARRASRAADARGRGARSAISPPRSTGSRARGS